MIYLDRASIHAEMLKRMPLLNPLKSSVSLSNDNGPFFATLHDGSPCQSGPIDIDWNCESIEDYHGLKIRILRWINVPAEHWNMLRAR